MHWETHKIGLEPDLDHFSATLEAVIKASQTVAYSKREPRGISTRFSGEWGAPIGLFSSEVLQVRKDCLWPLTTSWSVEDVRHSVGMTRRDPPFSVARANFSIATLCFEYLDEVEPLAYSGALVYRATIIRTY